MRSYTLNEGTDHALRIEYPYNQVNLEALLVKTESLNKQLLQYKSNKGQSNLEHEINSSVEALHAYNPVNLMKLKQDTEHLYSTTPFSVSCKRYGWANKCTEFISQWALESESTIYWLRFLSSSLVRVRGEPPTVTIEAWDDVWVHCKKRIVFPNQSTRMIMGIGPSGCGKSTIAKTIFPWFPDIVTIVFIDGGISRETSLVWNIATAFSNGISDLYKIFSKHSSKDELFTWLKGHRCSFYVADTLSNGQTAQNFAYYKATGIDRSPDITKYTGLDPHWIALFIWQHLNTPKSKKMCTYPDGYTCVGCDVSGKRRQVSEGKPYDSNAYLISKHASLLALKQSTHQFFIHNAGSDKAKTVIAYQSSAITPTILRETETKHPNLVMMPVEMNTKTFKEINNAIFSRLNHPHEGASTSNVVQRAFRRISTPKKPWGGLKTRKVKKYKTRKYRNTN